MARKTYFQLLAQAAATLEDNTTGNITPADVRGMVTDFLDSFAPAYGVLQTVTPFTVTAQLVDGAALPFDTVYIANAPEWVANAAGGTVQRADSPNTSQITVQLTLETNNGRQVTATVYRDGVPTAFSASVTGAGAGNPVGLNIFVVSTSSAAATYDVRLRSDVAATSVTINSAIFIGQAVPLRGTP
jgi:hypothetical protein